MRTDQGDPEAMARIYDLAWDWAQRVLPQGDSILTPGEQIWTLENLRELEEKFIGRPDVALGSPFLTRVQEQLRDASPAAVQLMVEVHVLYFWWVWEGAISASKKLADLRAILSWLPERPTLAPEIEASMGPGIAHPGQWAMVHRETQLASLVRVATALASRSSADYAGLLSSPFAFRDAVFAAPAPSGDTAKHGLIHLVFPDTFESIVSGSHKQCIIDRFGEHTGEAPDTDAALLQIRQELSSAGWGEGFSYYDDINDPLLHLWSKNTKTWGALLHWIERVSATFDLEADERSYKLSVAAELRGGRAAMMAGADGWWEVLRRAMVHRENNLFGWRHRGEFVRWMKENPADAEAALRTLWEVDSGRSEPQRIDAFAAAIRPSGLTTTGSVVNLAAGLLMASRPQDQPPLKVDLTRRLWRLAGWGNEPANSTPGHVIVRAYAFFDELVRDSAAADHPLRDRLDAQSALWALGHLNERPVTWTEQEWAEFTAFRGGAETEEPEPVEGLTPEPEPVVVPSKDFVAVAAKDLHVSRGFLDTIVTLLEDKGQVVFYGPPGTGKTYLAKRLARAIVEEEPDRMTVVQFHPATTYEDFFEGLRPRLGEDGHISYELRRGPLSLLAKEALDHPEHSYVMVIDELNRANLPKVLGELLFLLEYRRESVATLYRPEEKFELPENLFFIATMNTADRSVALVDAALRRRFHFVPFFPHQGEMKGLLRRWLTDHGQATVVADLLDAVNEELRGHVGDHLVIGPSHFMKGDLSEEALARIWEFNIYPTLEELLWGRTDELKVWQWTAVRHRYATLLHLPVDDAVSVAVAAVTDAEL